MFHLPMMTFIPLIIPMMMYVMFLGLTKMTWTAKTKNTPFECGFSPISKSRHSLSIQFFMIAIIFLIFDVELTLIMPMVMNTKLNMTANNTLIMFMTLITMGALYEWYSGSLKWYM